MIKLTLATGTCQPPTAPRGTRVGAPAGDGNTHGRGCYHASKLRCGGSAHGAMGGRDQCSGARRGADRSAGAAARLWEARVGRQLTPALDKVGIFGFTYLFFENTIELPHVRVHSIGNKRNSSRRLLHCSRLPSAIDLQQSGASISKTAALHQKQIQETREA